MDGREAQADHERVCQCYGLVFPHAATRALANKNPNPIIPNVRSRMISVKVNPAMPPSAIDAAKLRMLNPNRKKNSGGTPCDGPANRGSTVFIGPN